MPSYLTGPQSQGVTPDYDPNTGQLVGFTNAQGQFVDAQQFPNAMAGFPQSMATSQQSAAPSSAGTVASYASRATNVGGHSVLAGAPTTWNGQNIIPLYDPNTLAFSGWSVNGQFQASGNSGSSGRTFDQNQGAQPVAATGKDVNAINEAFPGQSPQFTDIGARNLPGIGNVDVQKSGAQTYYKNAQGQNVALDAAQLGELGINPVIGYDTNGNPYYGPAPNKAQTALAEQQAQAATPEQAAWESASATDPQMAQIIKNLEQQNVNQTTQGGTAIPQLEQTYLNQQDQLDPTSAKGRDTLASSYLGDVTAANAGQLPAGVANQVQEAARTAQTARGNALGTAQASQEAMATGLTGLQIKQQAQQNEQSWLSSGLTKGQQGAALYDWRSGLGNNAISYLSSGQTPYGVGTSQLANIQNQAQAGNQGAQYSPSYSGGPNFSYINPQSGSDFSQGANNWYNSQTNSALGAAGIKSQNQANTYGLIGGIIKGVSSIAGAAIGACWVAREAFGFDNPKWLEFRDWMLKEAPEDFRGFYMKNGPEIAKAIKHQPMIKELIAHLMKEVLDGQKK